MRDGSADFAPSGMSIFLVGYGSLMPPHRDWTRHGVGRALLWWPFTAFVTVAAFPALAVPGVIATGVFLIVVGLVGGFVGRRRRARRLREAGRILGAAPRAVAAAVRPPSTGSDDREDSEATGATTDDAEGDRPADQERRAA